MLRFIVAGLLAGLAFSAVAEPQKIREVGGIAEYRLDNGMQVLLMPVAGAGRTHVTVTYKVGSRMEGAGEAGMAHLLEHVTFRGLRDDGGQALDLGAELKKLPLEYNGTTTNDRTNYFENFTADDGVLSRVIELEARRMRAARLEQGDFDKEKPIVLNEMGMRGENLSRQMHQALAAAVFRSHPYGRPTIGYPQEIEALSLDRLRAFYGKYYRPDNAVLMLAGEFDAQQALASIERYFGPLPRPTEALPPPVPAEPPQSGPRQVVTRTSQTAVGLAYRVPAWAHPKSAAIAMLFPLLPSVRDAYRYTRDSWAPLDAEVQELRSRDPYLIEIIWPMPKTASNDAKSRAALMERAADLAQEMEMTKVTYENAIRLAIEERRNQLLQQLRNPGQASALISDAIGAGDWRLPLRMLDDLAKLDPLEVIHAFDEYVTPQNRSLVVGVTDEAVTAPQFSQGSVGGLLGLFAKPTKVEAVDDASAVVGQLDKAGAALGSTGGDAFEFDPARLDAAVQRLRLPSGVLVELLDRKTADDRIHVQMKFSWGSPQGMAAEQGWRALIEPYLETGTKGDAGYSMRDIAVFKSRAQLRWSLQSLPQQLLVNLSMPREHFVSSLALLRAVLREPELSESVFVGMKEALLKQWNNSDEEPDWAPELARRHQMEALGLRSGSPGYQPGKADLIAAWKALDIATVRSFHKRLWSANELHVSVVGPVPSTVITASAFEQFFGDWKRPEAPAYERFASEFKPVDGARFVSARSETGQGRPPGSAYMAFQQSFPLNRRDPDAVPLQLGLRILAAPGITGSRLTDRLRGRDALSYSIDYVAEIPLRGNAAAVSLMVIASPSNAARAEAATREEIARLLEQGINEAELLAAKREMRTAWRDRLGNDATLAGLLLSQQDSGEDFALTAARDSTALQAATVDSVNAALRRLLLPDRWVTIITGASMPKKEAAQEPPGVAAQ